MIDVGDFKRQLEELGEEEVRKKLTLKHYGDAKRAIAEEWLSSRASTRQESRQDTHLNIAASAKRAAWVAAIGAVVSALAAIAAWLSTCSLLSNQ